MCAERPLADFFEACAKAYGDPKKLANWLLGEFARLRNEGQVAMSGLKVAPAQLVELLQQVDGGVVSGNAGKEVLAEMFRTGLAPTAIIAQKGLAQVSDAGAIDAAVDQVLSQNADSVAKYKAGKVQVLGFLVGQVMKAMKGKGNPQLVNEALKKKLG